MEESIYPLPAVQKEFEHFVLVQLFTDGPDKDKNRKIMIERFHTAGLPLYVILDPQGSEVARSAFTKDPKEFIAFLKRRPA